MKTSILKVTFILFGMVLSCTILAQEEGHSKKTNQEQQHNSKDAPPPPAPPQVVDEIFKEVDQMPRFPGCEDRGLSEEELVKCSNNLMGQYMYRKIKYPARARENGTKGTVVIRFIVDKVGNLQDVSILEDVADGCGQAALKVIKQMQNEIQFIPGKQRGRPVKVEITLPFKFDL